MELSNDISLATEQDAHDGITAAGELSTAVCVRYLYGTNPLGNLETAELRWRDWSRRRTRTHEQSPAQHLSEQEEECN